VEILASPAYRQPAIASGINGGDLLKRRVRMIVSKNHSRSNLRWLQVCILLGALIVLPLGLTKAQEGNENKPQKEKEDLIELQELKASVLQAQEALQARQISQNEAQKRLAELEQQLAQRSMNLDAAAHQVQEAAGEISRKQAELEALSETLTKKQALLEALSKTYTPDHPDIIRLSKELEKLSAQMQKSTTANIFKPIASTDRTNVLHPSTDYAAVLKAAVADGMLTEEYVEDKLAEMENAQFERYGRMLIDAVEAGNITEEEAAARKAEYLELLNAMKEKQQLDLQEEQ
jgi:uncharacterized coiled-coil protein SlyX